MQWELWTSSGRVAHSARMLTQRHCFYHNYDLIIDNEMVHHVT